MRDDLSGELAGEQDGQGGDHEGSEAFFSEEKSKRLLRALSRNCPETGAHVAEVFWFFFSKILCFPDDPNFYIPKSSASKARKPFFSRKRSKKLLLGCRGPFRRARDSGGKNFLVLFKKELLALAIFGK